MDSVNLVFQQANVLRCGLDHNVEGICGSMGTSLWNKQTWDTCFSSNMVIICTAAVLLDCMMHSFIDMARINLLIFDEAHHAKGNHPYALLIKDYYSKELNLSKRPRIFSMTASPVDVKGLSVKHVQEKALDLEKLLHSKIATTTESTLASNNISKPEEEVVFYQPLETNHNTFLHATLQAKYGQFAAFRKLFKASRVHAAELGRWASDMYWSFAFAEEESNKRQRREEFKFNKKAINGEVAELDAQMKILKEAAVFVQGFDIGSPSLDSQDVSDKVQRLHHWLNLYYERTDTAHCIVFVEKRQTARLLKVLFDKIGGPNLRCDVLVGVSSRQGEHNISLRSQILTLQKFRRGELNCLFATSVAEEGLDIPQCNIVVRFDLYRTMIEYIQSRGRARHRNSKYLHMLENGNHSHRGRVIDVKHDETVMRDFCSNLTHDRILNDMNKDEDDLFALDDKLFPSYIDPFSGAKLTFRASLSVLNHFVATWPAPNNESMWQPTYVIDPQTSFDPCHPQRGFLCEVILPEHCPLISMRGDVHSKKAAAKCSAAFKMCVELRRKDYLNEHLLPTMQKRLPSQRNALLAVSEKKKGSYPMIIKPEFWKQSRGTIPQHLYLTVVNVDAGLDRVHQPLGLLTRLPMPQLPTFPIYLTDGRPSNVVSLKANAPIVLTEELLGLFTKFTLQIFQDIYNKEYEYDTQKMSYWVVPILASTVSRDFLSHDAMQTLDMEQIKKVTARPSWQWTPGTMTNDLIDKYFVDPMNGGRRYYSNCLATHLTPQDPVPSHVPKQNHKFMSSILDYTDSKWLKSRDVSKWDRNQPVLEVEKIPFRRNHLANIEEKEKQEHDNLKTYICPQPLKISNVSITDE